MTAEVASSIFSALSEETRADVMEVCTDGSKVSKETTTSVSAGMGVYLLEEKHFQRWKLNPRTINNDCGALCHLEGTRLSQCTS